MIWGKHPKEYRPRFAIFPVLISYKWIWLEWYDATGWYYSWEQDDLVKSRRYPSRLKSK